MPCAPIRPNQELLTRETAESILRGALAENRLFAIFQPVVNASRRDTACFYEALLRLRTETGEVIPAGRFIPYVEATPLGRELDRFVLRRTLDVLTLNPTARISVNIAPETIGDPAWCELILRAFKRDPFTTERLIVEITEMSAMQDIHAAAQFMRNLRQTGIRFAVDDFGAGQTSLRYFRELPFDILKIDGHFIQHLDQNPGDQVIIRAICDIARHFDMLVVAEWIENDRTADIAQSLGVGALQGFRFGAGTERPETVAPAASAGASNESRRESA